MSDLKPLWSDGKSDDDIGYIADMDSDLVIANLRVDMLCLNERNKAAQSRIAELEEQLLINQGIIKNLGDKNAERIDIQKKCYGLVKGMAADDFTYEEVYRILFMTVDDFLMDGKLKP